MSRELSGQTAAVEKVRQARKEMVLNDAQEIALIDILEAVAEGDWDIAMDLIDEAKDLLAEYRKLGAVTKYMATED